MFLSLRYRRTITGVVQGLYIITMFVDGEVIMVLRMILFPPMRAGFVWFDPHE